MQRAATAAAAAAAASIYGCDSLVVTLSRHSSSSRHVHPESISSCQLRINGRKSILFGSGISPWSVIHFFVIL